MVTGRAWREGVQGVHRTWARVQWDPGSGGPEELRLSRQVLDQIFFLPCPSSIPEFFFALHLILGKKLDQI